LYSYELRAARQEVIAKREQGPVTCARESVWLRVNHSNEDVMVDASRLPLFQTLSPLQAAYGNVDFLAVRMVLKSQ
jgi:hypothetical protein